MNKGIKKRLYTEISKADAKKIGVTLLLKISYQKDCQPFPGVQVLL